jgi:hypothetical protein
MCLRCDEKVEAGVGAECLVFRVEVDRGAGGRAGGFRLCCFRYWY